MDKPEPITKILEAIQQRRLSALKNSSPTIDSTLPNTSHRAFGPLDSNLLPMFCLRAGISAQDALMHVSLLLFCAEQTSNEITELGNGESPVAAVAGCDRGLSPRKSGPHGLPDRSHGPVSRLLRNRSQPRCAPQRLHNTGAPLSIYPPTQSRPGYVRCVWPGTGLCPPRRSIGVSCRFAAG